MQYINAVLNTVVDAALAGLRWQNAWPALIAASLLSTVLLLMVMRFASAPARIERSKKRLLARVMELHLFRHDPIVTLTACWRIAAANVIYLRHLIVPMFFAALPGLLILIQLDCWFGHRPLQVAEVAIVEVDLKPDANVVAEHYEVSTSDSLVVDSPALRIPSMRQVAWRLRVVELEDGWFEVSANGQPVRKHVAVGKALAKTSQQRVGAGVWEALWNPVEPPLPAASGIQAVRVRYPRREFYIGLHEMEWLFPFVVLTILFGMLLKAPLKVPL